MKKTCVFLVIGLIVSFSAVAQDELKPFKVDVSAGYAMPGGSGSKGGVLFVVEPKYAIMPALALGLRMEVAIVARFSGYDTNGDPLDLDVKGAGSYLATGDYYFAGNYNFRPFGGAGAGVFSLASVSVDASGNEAAGESTQFGGMIRGGIEAGHFRFGIEYNIIPTTMIDGFDSNGNPAKITSKNSYLGIKIGICLGGGPY